MFPQLLSLGSQYLSKKVSNAFSGLTKPTIYTKPQTQTTTPLGSKITFGPTTVGGVVTNPGDSSYSKPVVPQVKPSTPQPQPATASFTPSTAATRSVAPSYPSLSSVNMGRTEEASRASTSSSSSRQRPATPAEPSQTALEIQKAEEDYRKALKLSPEEMSTQGDLDRLTESYMKGVAGTKDKVIPMEFITGQLAFRS